MSTYKDLNFIDDRAIIKFDNNRTLHVYKEQMLGTIEATPRYIWSFLEFLGGWNVQTSLKSVATEEEVTRILNEVEGREASND